MSTPDIAAAIERVREALQQAKWSAFMEDNEPERREALADFAAIEARIAEVERERDYFRDRLPDFSAVQQADFARAEAAEADLLLAAQQNTRLSERVDRAEGALRAIRQWDMLDVTDDGPYWKRTLDAALAEEPYADIPGAGQRGC